MMSRLSRIRALEAHSDEHEEWCGAGLSALLAYAKRHGITPGAMPPADAPPTGLGLLLAQIGEEGRHA